VRDLFVVSTKPKKQQTRTIQKKGGAESGGELTANSRRRRRSGAQRSVRGGQCLGKNIEKRKKKVKKKSGNASSNWREGSRPRRGSAFRPIEIEIVENVGAGQLLGGKDKQQLIKGEKISARGSLRRIIISSSRRLRRTRWLKTAANYQRKLGCSEGPLFMGGEVSV